MTDAGPPEYPAEPPLEPLATPAPPPPASPSGAWQEPTGIWQAPTTTLPTYTVATQPGRGRRASIAVATVVVLLAGAFGVSQLLGGADDGATDPEGAMATFLTALEDEDVLGMLDALTPGERDVLRQVVESDTSELERLGVLGDSFRLDGIAGIEITITDPQFEVDEITDGEGGDDGLAMVSVVGGVATVAVDGQALTGNLGDVIDAILDETGTDTTVDDSEETTRFGDEPFTVAAVETGGRWHLSAFFTAAEAVRSGLDTGELPDLANPAVTPQGADSPEGAVEAMARAAADLDLAGVLAVLPPDEARVLHVYAQYFLADAEEAAADVRDRFAISIDFTGFEVDDLGGGTNRVIPTGLEASIAGDGFDGTFSLDGDCFSYDITDNGDSQIDEFCRGDDLGETLQAPFGGDIEVPPDVQDVFAVFDDVRSGFVTVQRGGAHFVSPVLTVNDLVFSLVRAVDRADLEEGGALFDAFTGRSDVGTFFDDLFDQALAGETEVFEPVPPIGEPCTGIGCGVGDLPFPQRDVPAPFGPSGPGGTMIVGDAVQLTFPDGGSATVLVTGDGSEVRIGAAAIDGVDAVITVTDETGMVLAENDDFIGFDPEVQLTLAPGQTAVVEIRGFADDAGEVLVYVAAI